MHQVLIDKQREIIEAFNAKPKNGIRMIKELLAEQPNVEVTKAIAEFFIAQKQNLDLDAVGDYISGPDDENMRVLTAFTAQIDFTGQSFTEGLRTYLNAFKLPGEAQKIDRVVESFSKAFCQQNPGNIATPNAAHILAFAIIMLNTDAHNPNVESKKKMTCDQFVSNLRGCNNEKDFDRELLREIYNDIYAQPFNFHFVKVNPGYEISSNALNKDATFSRVDLFLQSQGVFPGLGENIKATVDKPKSWLNNLTGYEGTITLTDSEKNASVTVQVYKPGLFSKWFLGEQPKVIIQPVNSTNSDAQATIDLAAKIAASFKSPVTSVNATYDYEQTDLKNALETAVAQNPATQVADDFKAWKADAKLVNQDLSQDGTFSP